MIEVLQALVQILNPKKYVQSLDSKLTITEKHRQATLRNITIQSIGTGALALKLDECGFPGNKIFVEQHDMHRACDAVVFCVVSGEPYILCLELKSSEPNRNEVKQQFQNAHCFLNYLDSLLITYHNQSIKSWSRRYFVFHDATKSLLNKPPLIDTPHNDTPESAQVMPVQNGENIYLRKLLSKPL